MLRFQLQRISAVGLVFFLFLHMIVMHYPPRELNHENILAQMENPWWKLIESMFLIFVMTHALTGTYAVLTDFDFLAKFRKAIVAVLLLVGVVATYWGMVTIISW